MKSRFYLPKEGTPGEAVSLALRYHYDSNENEYRQHSWEWTKLHWYLQGVRRIRPWPSYDGLPASTFTDTEGARRVRIDKLPMLLQNEMGKALSLDISPSVQRPSGITLDALRRTALWQCFYDNFWNRFDSDSFTQDLFYHLFAYGTVGVGAFDCPDLMGGVLGSTLVLVPPWELRPLSSCPTRISDVTGVVWDRWVPLDWMTENYEGILKMPKDRTKLRPVTAPSGSKLNVTMAPATTMAGAVNTGGFGGSFLAGSELLNRFKTKSDATKASLDYVQMREHWVWGDDHTLLRWIVMLGDAVVLDVDYTSAVDRRRYSLEGNNLPIAPLHIARYLTVGSFWGQGLLSRAMALTKEFEFLFAHTIQNMIDRDMLMALAVPIDGQFRLNDMKTQLRNRLIPYAPNPNAPALSPEVIAPPNSGDANLRILGAMNGIITDITGVGPMQSGQAPGRIDSAGGLAIIEEAQSKNQLPMIKSLSSCMKGVYKALASTMSNYVQGLAKQAGNKAFELDLIRIDEAMVGVQLDRSSGKISVDPGVLKDPQRIWVGLRQDTPRPKSSIRQDLDGMLKMGVISPVQWQIAVLREGLDIPLVNKAPYYNYVQGWLENIQLFNDGQTPGEISYNELAENVNIKLMTLGEFMASPTFLIASPAVQQAFEERRMTLEQQKGTLPQGLMSMDQMGNPNYVQGLMGQLTGAGMPPPGGPPSLNPSMMQTMT